MSGSVYTKFLCMTAAAWATAGNPIIEAKRLVFEDEGDGTFKAKLGDGATAYNLLPYLRSRMDTGTTSSTAAVGNDGRLVHHVRGVATSNLTVASALVNGLVVDAVTYATGERILLTGQTAPAENGPYTIVASGAAPRASAAVEGNTLFAVNEGTVNHDTLWWVTTNNPIVVGTTALAIVTAFDPSGAAATALAAAVAKMLGIYGDGSDGAIAVDGTTAALAGAWSRTGSGSGAVYTLLRDIYGSTITVSNNCILNAGGFRVYASTSLTVNSGSVVHNDGNAATGVTSGATSPGGTSCTLGNGKAGGNGGTTGIGSAGTASSNAALGGAGGAGGAGTVAAGGGAGAITAPPASSGLPRALVTALSLIQQGTATQFFGGAGGGGGGGNASGSGQSGGGGGGGGGVLAVYALTIVNSGTIRSNGGAGAAGTLGTSAGTGGGGGGGGGAVIVVSSSASNGTVQANGGAGGALVGTGHVGVAGSNGTVIWHVG